VEAKRIKVKTLAASVSAVLIVETLMRMTFLASSLLGLGITRSIQVLLMVWIVRAMGDATASIGLERSSWAPGFRKGLIWSAAFGIVALCAAALLSLAGMDVLFMIRTPLPHDIRTMTLYFLVGGIVAPVAEEIFFRGLLYGFLRRYGAPLAVIVTTALFASVHPLRGIPLIQIVGGLVFALAYEVEGKLLVPIIIHVLGNLAIFTISALP